MLEFIHNNFKLDLTHLKPTYTEENLWFKNDIQSDYSYPFEIPYNEWLKISSLSHPNSIDRQTSFIGKLNTDGVIQDATLQVTEIQGKKTQGTLLVGFEDFTVFDKKLSELNLEKNSVENLKQHALSCITKNYPEVNYNFGMVHTNKYDSNTEFYNGFEKTINNYIDGAFVENRLEPDTNLDQIRNIMQPFPYALYLLKQGFALNGKTLAGDVLEIPELKKALVFADNEYSYKISNQDNLEVKIAFYGERTFYKTEKLTPTKTIDLYKYTVELEISKKGDYIILGEIFDYTLRSYGVFVPNAYSSTTSYSYNIKQKKGKTETFVFQSNFNRNTETWINHGYVNQEFREIHLDISIKAEAGDTLLIEIIQADKPKDFKEDYPYVIDFKLIPVRYYKDDGTPILSVTDRNEIDLALCVPDMTFKTFVEQIMKLKKLDLVPKGNIVYMNYVSKQLIDRENAIDFTKSEVLEPTLIINDTRSYELKFTDGAKNENYIYDAYYIDKKGAHKNNYATANDTTQLYIDALPYPETFVNNCKSCFAFDDEKTKLRLVSFEAIAFTGVGSAQPITFQDKKLLIPYIYEYNYKDFLNFSIFSITYQWDNIISVETMRNITANTILYTYTNYHVLTEIEKERLNQLWWRVTIKTESIL